MTAVYVRNACKRHCHTPDYIPKWKEKRLYTPRLMQKCIHPQCTDTDKLIHASFDETDNLEAALGVTITPCYVHVCVYMYLLQPHPSTKLWYTFVLEYL